MLGKFKSYKDGWLTLEDPLIKPVTVNEKACEERKSVTIDGKEATLEDLQLGMQVELDGNPVVGIKAYTK